MTIAVRSADPVRHRKQSARIDQHLLQFAPTPDLKAFGEALDLLSEDFDGYALEYTLLGLPINAGLSLGAALHVYTRSDRRDRVAGACRLHRRHRSGKRSRQFVHADGTRTVAEDLTGIAISGSEVL